LHKALRKYGLENFIIEIIETCNSLDELNEKEIYWISFFKSVNNKFGYNLDSGGKLKKHNEQSIINKRLKAKTTYVAQYNLKG
jgi:hypothetical protein